MPTQQEISTATVDRLLAELANTDDPAHADALMSQLRLHAELAGLSLEDVAKLAAAKSEPVKTAKPAKAVEG